LDAPKMEDPALASQDGKKRLRFMGEEKISPWGGVRKILIRSANWVGDAVMSLPALASVRRSFPRAEIFILAKPWVADLFRGSPEIDRVILYQSPGIHEGFGGKWRLARELKLERFDLALHLPNSFESALISFLAGIRQRAGYNTDGRGIILTHRVPVNGKIRKGHQVEYYLHLLKSLGFQPAGGVPTLKTSPKLLEEAEGILQSHGVKESGPLIGVSPGAQYGSAKEWFPERYGELADRISREMGARILIVGSMGDRLVASQICRRAGPAAIDLTGSTTLAQAIGIIARCRLFITNDSGLMHVASALRVPLVAIFGSTDPRRTGPLSENSRVLYKSIPCAPCLKTECPEDRKCMELITVDEVYEEIKKIWDAESKGVIEKKVTL
jgi:heptosyltransferase-2